MADSRNPAHNADTGPLSDTGLARSYRRLIRCYPPGPRRDELLDTLIEAAAPGRRRPSVRETANLVRHGLRARLGRPASRVVAVLAGLVALAGAFLGASGANSLGWHAVGPLPAGAEAEAIRETVLPGLHVWGGGDAAKIVTQSDGDGVELGYAVSWAKHTPATRDVDAYLAAASGRLVAAGWHVTEVDPAVDNTDVVGADPGDRQGGFTAVRDGLAVHVSDSYWPGRPSYDSDGSVGYHVWHRQSPWLTAVTYLGALVGAVLAWLLTGWASRRLEPAREASIAAGAAAWAALLFLVPAALMAIPPGQSADETTSPFWDGLMYLGREPAMLSGALVLFVLGAAALQRPWRPPGIDRRRIARRAVPLALVVVAVATAVGGYAWTGGGRACTPVAPSGVQDPVSARLSYDSKVFASPQSTAEQLNEVQAAIGRGFGGALTFNRDPRSTDFSATYCRHGRVPTALADSLPWYWTVDLASPGLFGGLAAEVSRMPGVVAVQHVAP